MRPINLIPEGERRSHGSTTRTGPLAYLIVGALGVLLIGVVMVVLTNNQISDRRAEVTGLEAELTAATSQAEALAPYVSFQQVAESRTQTIASLADTRFDWVRVIRQLSLILPPRTYLTSLTGSAGGGGEEVASGVPSLNLAGCAPGQEIVASFVAALKEIDGVTRVGLGSSTSAGEGGAQDEEGEGGAGCGAAGAYDFQVTALFDSAPPSPDSGLGLAEAEAPAESEGESAEAEPSTETTETEGSSEASASTATAETAG